MKWIVIVRATTDQPGEAFGPFDHQDEAEKFANHVDLQGMHWVEVICLKPPAQFTFRGPFPADDADEDALYQYAH